MPRGIPNNTDGEKTTTRRADRPEPTLAELRKKLAPKTRPEPSAEQKDKEARTVAVQTEIANFSDRLISLASVTLPDGSVVIDEEVDAQLKKSVNYLDLVSKATVAAVKAISSSHYEEPADPDEDLGL